MKAKIFTIVVLGMLFLSNSICQAQNTLYDGNFSTTTSINSYFDQPPPNTIWYAWQNWQINNNITVVDGVCKYDVATLGADKNTWDIQLIQTGFELIKGHAYQLSFDVKADANRSFGLYLGENGGNWTSLIGYDRYNQFAATNWKTITLDFVASFAFNNNKLSFELGAEKGVTYFDNVMLVDMGVSIPSIGILGTSLNGWDVDVDLQTTDGVTYTLLNYPLTYGFVKFRQDNNWNINWGNNTFPSGIAYLYGPDIPVLTYGNFDISFNIVTGEYSFTCVSNCPASIGILGSAVPPDFSWDIDVKMGTNDGINYTLKNYAFIDGEAKFRQDNSWDINWGNTTFPTGTALSNGPNIPVKAGTYNVSFNKITGNYSFEIPMIGIIGSALNGWDVDIDMQTTDGITYTLLNYPFKDGFAKFRQDDSWDTNWGGYDFPKGLAFLNGFGNDIPIPAGNYNVSFNRITGDYVFVATTCPIAGIQCPWDVYVNTDMGMCGAMVNFPAVTAAANCGGEGITIKQTKGLASGSFFPVGSTWNAFELKNSEGKTATCGFYVNVIDLPKIKSIPDLWPPNHKMVPISLNFTNNCGEDIKVIDYFIYNISSNEPDNGLGDGDMPNDWQLNGQNILLRAERSGKGTGRIYSFNVTGYDESMNWFNQIVTVTVPHNKVVKVIRANPIKKVITTDNSIENISFTTTLWPNPSSNSFNLEVQSTSNEKVILNIFDINGRLISNYNTNSNETTAFGKDLIAGIYIIQVTQGKNSNIIKVVKH